MPNLVAMPAEKYREGRLYFGAASVLLVLWVEVLAVGLVFLFRQTGGVDQWSPTQRLAVVFATEVSMGLAIMAYILKDYFAIASQAEVQGLAHLKTNATTDRILADVRAQGRPLTTGEANLIKQALRP